MDGVTIVLVLTTITSGLVAGLLYAYSCSVNPGLSNLPDHQYLSAMQSINLAIQNPVFFVSFMGTLILLPVSTLINYGTGRFPFLIAAALFYVVGVFGITLGGNVPLNNTLARIDIANASTDALHQARMAFEPSWNRFHLFRTVASVISLILVVIACVTDRAGIK